STPRPPPRSPLFPYTTLFRSSGPEPIRALPCSVASESIFERGTYGGGNTATGKPCCASSSRRSSACASSASCARSSSTVSSKTRSEEHTSELQSPYDLVCRLL